LLQSPTSSFTVSIVKQLSPSVIQHGLLDGQVLSTHADQSLETALYVATYEETPGGCHRPSWAVHHADPGRWRVAQCSALVDRTFASLLELALQRHARQHDRR